MTSTINISPSWLLKAKERVLWWKLQRIMRMRLKTFRTNMFSSFCAVDQLCQFCLSTFIGKVIFKRNENVKIYFKSLHHVGNNGRQLVD